MIVALSLTITGSLNIFEGHAKSGSYTQWKVGTVLIVVAWAFQVFWSLFSLLPIRGSKGSPGYHGGTAVSFSKNVRFLEVVANNSLYSSSREPLLPFSSSVCGFFMELSLFSPREEISVPFMDRLLFESFSCFFLKSLRLLR
jgi:hypothetical protein